ncbi:hypothetical protein BDP27DRAFT_1430050 [Rhodocollybia butyracea]|uniref:Uncharacterized protein n=1 Tax=Rhodocollybia butyracea TaxID=206335 RepID=A0A9P5TZL2_9AGAR|nr:hypothetical protein BDP27DRAFT_1430050 [Rhodocollybia butyracea]
MPRGIHSYMAAKTNLRHDKDSQDEKRQDQYDIDLPSVKAAKQLSPVTYSAVQACPGILTQYAKTSVLRSMDGRVGNILPKNILVSSPNTDVVYLPPLGACRPFSSNTAHLALIKSPSPDPQHKFHCAWVIPTDRHFVELPSSGICLGLGTLAQTFRSELEALATNVLSHMPSTHARSDEYLILGSTQIKRLLDRLHLPASREELFLRVACLQRQILELNARNHWLGPEWQERINDAKARRRTHEPADIIGAFTEDLDHLDLLFYAGIPVWFVRSVSKTPEARIDKVVPITSEDVRQRLLLPSGHTIDCRDAFPPRRLVYDGLAAKPERYMAMATYIRSLFNYSSLFGSPEPRSFASLRNANNALPSSPTLPMNSSSTNHTQRDRAQPYSTQQRNKPKPIVKQGVNTFLEPISPLMPLSIPIWENALKLLSNYNQSLPKSSEINGGYYLPPPRFFISPQNATTRCILYHGWLRIRELVLYLLASPTCDSLCLSYKEWHALSDITSGFWSPNSSERETKRGKHHVQMMEVVERSLQQSSVSLKLEVIAFQFTCWQGKELFRSELPEAAICRRILWEVNELNFRQELIALDRQLDTSHATSVGRRDMLDACWVGSADNVEELKGNEGLAEKVLEDRLPFLHALHKVMSTWRGHRPAELVENFPVNFQAHNFNLVVDRAERAMANFYTSAFLDVFGRAASIPRRL